MEFAEWEPVYESILADFGFDRAADEAARDELADVLAGTEPVGPESMRGARVAVVGAGPSLQSPEAIARARDCDRVVAASSAVDVLEAAGATVDCMVTDLDKNPETVVRLTRRDTPVVVHAHGDNRPAIHAVVPDCRLESVLGTTQAAPRGPVRNFGGFTDGDRAAFLADALGAAALVFVGWDLDDPSVAPTKARKLAWAERLLYWLERRRGERFGVLDGRREGIETAALPVE